MSVESLRWYQWLVVGACAGAVLGAVRVATTPAPSDLPVRTLGQAEFEEGLLRPANDDQPALADVVVRPADGTGTCWITGLQRSRMRLHADTADPHSPLVEATITTPFKYPAAAADYRPLWGVRPGTSGAATRLSDAERQATPPTTPFAFLTAVRNARPAATPDYSYAWYDPPPIRWSLWTAGTAAIAGGAWPPVLALLVGAGLGRRRPEAAYDLSRFGQAEEGTAKAVPDRSTLDVDGLIDGLIGGLTGMPDPAPRPEPVRSPPPCRPPALPAEPAVAEQAAGPAEAQGFRGEFYPTVVHVPPSPAGRAISGEGRGIASQRCS